MLTSTEDTFEIPTGNSFPSLAELDRLWAAAEFYPVRQRWTSSLPPPDGNWTDAEDCVARRVAEVHGSEALYAVVRQQEAAVGDLLASGRVRGLLVVVARA